MTRALAYLWPGLVQLRRGQWVTGLVLGLATLALLAGLLAADLEYLELSRRWRGPRLPGRELWQAKSANRRLGVAALLGLIAWGALHARLTRGTLGPDEGA